MRVARRVSQRLRGRTTPQEVCDVLCGGPADVALLRTIVSALHDQQGAFMLEGLRPVVVVAS